MGAVPARADADDDVDARARPGGGVLRAELPRLPHRSPNGLLPTIATEADDRRRAAEQAEARSAAQLADAVAAWEQRRGSRRTAVAAEGYPARDLAADLDLLDPRPDDDSGSAARLPSRRLVETARRAPALFSPPVARMVVDLADGLADPTACTILRLLARTGQVTRRAAAAAGAHALARIASPEAGRLVAELAGELHDDEAARALTGAIVVAGDDDDGFIGIRRPAEPASLLALAARDRGSHHWSRRGAGRRGGPTPRRRRESSPILADLRPGPGHRAGPGPGGVQTRRGRGLRREPRLCRSRAGTSWRAWSASCDSGTTPLSRRRRCGKRRRSCSAASMVAGAAGSRTRRPTSSWPSRPTTRPTCCRAETPCSRRYSPHVSRRRPRRCTCRAATQNPQTST